MLSRRYIVKCSHCKKDLSSVQWCSSCKKVAYCNRLCQKKNWKKHRPTCTYDYIQWNTKKYNYEMAEKYRKKNRHKRIIQPFNSIPTSLFSKKTFIDFLFQCNNSLLPPFGLIIYSLLTGYKSTISLLSSFPSDILSTMHGQNKIELYFDEGACPPIDLQRHTWFSGTGGSISILQKLNKHCAECTECLSEILQVFSSKNQEYITQKFYSLKIPKHIGYNWDGFEYCIQFVRDGTDDSLSILLQTFNKENRNMDAGEFIQHYQYSLASFRCNNIMPYFDGHHYAYLLKVVLDNYQFDSMYYKKITEIGFSWSLTNDIELKRQFLKTVHTLIHSNITPNNDYFVKPY